MYAVILVGGKGNGLSELTRDTENPIPKCLATVGDKTVLEHQIDQLKKIGVTNIILCESYLSDVIKQFFTNKNEDKDENTYEGVHLDHLVLEEDLGSAGAMKEASDMIPKEQLHAPFLYGDIFSDVQLQQMMNLHEQCYNEMGPDQEGEGLVTILGVMFKHPKGKLYITADGYHVDTYEKPEEPINGGMFILSREIYSLLPDQGIFTSKDVLDSFPSRNKVYYEHNGLWRDTGTMAELKLAGSEWETKLIQERYVRGVERLFN